MYYVVHSPFAISLQVQYKTVGPIRSPKEVTESKGKNEAYGSHCTVSYVVDYERQQNEMDVGI